MPDRFWRDGAKVCYVCARMATGSPIHRACPICWRVLRNIDEAHHGGCAPAQLVDDPERKARVETYRRRAEQRLPLFTEDRSCTF